MNVTIDLPIKWQAGWKVVKATIVDVAPHITVATFAVHKCPQFNRYVVSNIETGFHVARGNNIKQAQESARSILLGKTDADVERAMGTERR